jgi:hypothetical protein
MLRCVRTTVRIDDDLLVAAKQRAAATGRTLTAVIEDALRESLYRPDAMSPPAELPTFTGRGLQAGVDLDDTSALLDLMDEPQRAPS